LADALSFFVRRPEVDGYHGARHASGATGHGIFATVRSHFQKSAQPNPIPTVSLTHETHPMKFASLLLALAALPLTGCAENSPPTADNQSAAIATPGNPDNPPVTMSGYVDTSTTAPIK
jgi:hypothetical protein